jgi:hypothetical protein
MGNIKKAFILFLSLLVFCIPLYSRASAVKGIVTETGTNEPIPYAGIVIVGTNIKTVTDVEGNFTLQTGLNKFEIEVSSIGYKTETKQVSAGQFVEIKLSADTKLLDEVVVKSKKKKYRNRNNPAVELIEKVIENKKINRTEALDYYKNEKYEKILFAVSNITPEFKQKNAFKKFQFVFENTDTNKLKGKEVLPIYLKESLADCYYRKSPKSRKEIIKADKMVSFEGYVDRQGITAYLKYFYQDIDIYDNNIIFLSNQFLSPLAVTAPVFYKYFLLDTVIVSGKQCAHLAFVPRSKTDLLFQGDLYVLLDSSYAVKKLEITVNGQINLNWVKTVKVHQEFDKIDGGFMLTNDKIDLDFGLTKEGKGIYGEREVSFKNFVVHLPIPDSIFSGLESTTLDSARFKTDSFWVEHRHKQLTQTESGTYKMIDSIKRVPVFKRAMDAMMLVLGGYKDYGYFEIGPVVSFCSYNPIEGFRLRLGGRTTPKMSRKINFETYLAYGFDDEKYKGYFGTTYSLTEKSIYEYPVKYLKASYQYDTKIPGQELEYVQEDNILLSYKRGINDKMLYNSKLKFEHLNEFHNHFSYTIGYQYVQQAPTGNLFFNPINYIQPGNRVKNINISEPYLILRYAPHEQFYQGKIYRTPVSNGYPVFQFQYNAGAKFFGNDYNYQSLKFSVSKRFYMSVLGYSDVIMETGKIFGKASYPYLNIHRANQTYSYQISSYNMMNFLEFVSDEYASLNVDHCFNGFFFNKVPLFKRLKLREVITLKVLYGDLTSENDPDKNSSLFKFPTDAQGIPLTYTFDKKPYIEGSIGVSNILRFFRVDIVKRYTYLDHPNVSEYGIRLRFKFDF